MSQNPTDESEGVEQQPAGQAAGTATVESYETDEGVVFYDAENPLAWVETSQPITLEELA